MPRGDLYSPEYESSLTKKNFKHYLHTQSAAAPGAADQTALEPKSKNSKKTLPAWIREGLEKIEKEKLQDKGDDSQEEEGDEVEEETEKPGVYDDEPSEEPEPALFTSKDLADFIASKTRALLTEILLKVTDSEIQQVCKDTLGKETQSRQRKGPSGSGSVKPKVTNYKGYEKKRKGNYACTRSFLWTVSVPVERCAVSCVWL